MREHEKAEVFGQAIAAMVKSAVHKAKPASPGAYAATVRADLRSRLQPVARELFRSHGDLTAEHLALLLEAGEHPPEPVPTAAGLPVVRATDPLPPAARKEIARQRIAAIKAELPSITKPPMPDRESA